MALFSIGQYHICDSETDLVLQKTRLGWVMGVGVSFQGKNRHIICQVCSLEQAVFRFWETEELSEKRENISNDSEIERHFKSTYKRDENGRFVITLPFKGDVQQLGEWQTRALKQLHAPKRRFEKNPEYERRYDKNMHQYIDLGHLQAISSHIQDNGYHMPHHGVEKDSSITTPLRVV